MEVEPPIKLEAVIQNKDEAMEDEYEIAELVKLEGSV